jgi:hypothetical protein
MKEEADEERQLWSEVKNSGNRIDQLVVRIFLHVLHNSQHVVVQSRGYY